MKRQVVRLRALGNNGLMSPLARRIALERDKVLRLGIQAARLCDSPQRDHAYRLRVLKKARDIIDALTAEEVTAAISEAKSDPAHLSWAEVAQCLDISKSAAYTRYGGNDERQRAN